MVTYLANDEEVFPLDIFADHVLEDLADLGLVQVDLGAVYVAVAVVDGKPRKRAAIKIITTTAVVVLHFLGKTKLSLLDAPGRKVHFFQPQSVLNFVLRSVMPSPHTNGWHESPGIELDKFSALFLVGHVSLFEKGYLNLGPRRDPTGRESNLKWTTVCEHVSFSSL